MTATLVRRVAHICIFAQDLDKTGWFWAEVLGAHGVVVSDKKFGIDATWQAWTADPNGVKVELFEYTERSAQFVGGDREADW